MHRLTFGFVVASLVLGGVGLGVGCGLNGSDVLFAASSTGTGGSTTTTGTGTGAATSSTAQTTSTTGPGATSTTTSSVAATTTTSSTGPTTSSSTAATTTTSATTGSTSASTSASSTSGGACSAGPMDTACLTCAKSMCCDDWMACANDNNCICWAGCGEMNPTNPAACVTPCGGAPDQVTQTLATCTTGNGACAMACACEPLATDSGCTTCAKQMCCSQVVACGTDPACLCASNCNPNDFFCMQQCGQSQAWNALVQCALGSCQGSCP